jgi:hypothetical protein
MSKNQVVRFLRQLIRIAKEVLGLALLVLEILKHLYDLFN